MKNRRGGIKVTKNDNFLFIGTFCLIILFVSFSLLFSNGLIGKKNLEVNIKIDRDRDYVYDRDNLYKNKYYDYSDGKNKMETIDKYGISIQYIPYHLDELKVPYININSKDAESANDKIEQLYLDYAKNFDLFAENSNVLCGQILTYRTYQYDDILSIVIIYDSECTSAFVFQYLIYNFDLKTGDMLSYKDVLSMLKYQSNQVLDSLKFSLKDKMNSLYPDVDLNRSYGVNCYDKANSLLEESIQNDSVLFFVDDDGVLNVLAIAYYNGIQNGDSNYYLIKVIL